MNKKRLVALAATLVMGVQTVAMPLLANAEASATYITNSDFKDCAVGGAKGDGYYGLNIIMDGSPWLSKGSASVCYETYRRDTERGVNYCNFYSNSDKSGSDDGAGSRYIYQRDTTTTFEQTYGHMKFDVRWNSGAVNMMAGSFSDPTSNTDYVGQTLTIGDGAIKAYDGTQQKTIAQIQAGKWYTVDMVCNNALQEWDIKITDIATGKNIGAGEGFMYQDSRCPEIRIWCFGYIRGKKYDYDLTNVTIEKSTDKKSPYKIF